MKGEKSKMNIRQAEKKDLDSICIQYENMYTILQGFGFPYSVNEGIIVDILDVFIKSKLYCVVVAEQDEIICGFICASINKLDRKLETETEKYVGIINDIYVEEQYRGRHIAQQLLEYAEEWIDELGINSVRADIVTNNTSAFNFWSKQGYAPLYTSVYKNLDC